METGVLVMIKIAPSILASDFSRLGLEIQRVADGGADLIHIDVMDGNYVPNITIGPPVIRCLRKVTDVPFDVHLMIDHADRFIDDFADAGADIITVHVEACTHLNRVIQTIRNRNVKPAVALNPATPLSSLEWILDDVEMVLLMTVNPGFGGQKYIPSCTEKIATLRQMITDKGLHTDIQIDGGISPANIYTVTKAGANVIVAGSSVFKHDDPGEVIRLLKAGAFSS